MYKDIIVAIKEGFMKKILLIIFLFFCCTNVYAQQKKFVATEVIPNIYYMKYDGTNKYYRDAYIIKEAGTNNISYCVEPATMLVNNTTYTSDAGFSQKYKITEANWNKAKLIAYYGYGYKNHTDKKWISITQLTIWRTLFPSYTFEWIDSKTSQKIIYPYNNEIKELNTLVNNHNVLPSLDSNYNLGINEHKVLNDTKKVLSNYKIISSDFDAKISSNSLIVDTQDEEKEGKIVLERASNIYNNTALFYYSSESQNVIERGNITPIKFTINIKVNKGKITVKKVDEETQEEIPQGEASLDGAVFELFDENMQSIKEVTVKDNTIEFDNLEFGKYYLKEKIAGNGYHLNDKLYEVEINENNIENEIVIGNNVIKSKVVIQKYYGSKSEIKNNIAKYEKNIEFEIYNSKNDLVYSGKTNDKGIIELELPYGKYMVKQKNSTLGYHFVDDFSFTINEDSNDPIYIPLYDIKIDVPNAGISFFKTIVDYMRCVWQSYLFFY